EAALLLDHEPAAARRARDVGHLRPGDLLPLGIPLERAGVLLVLPPGAADELPAALDAVAALQRPAALRAHLAGQLADRRRLVAGLLEQLRERAPELVEYLLVVTLARLDVVQLLLEVAGELQVHDPR